MGGIPTTYRDVLFRSRAEARWAAFFDACGWSWSYEPLDLAGYIPDFVLNFHEPLLVEVKGGATFAEELERHTAKIERSGWERNALLLPSWLAFGADLTPRRGCQDHAIEALVSQRYKSEPSDWCFDRATIGRCYGHLGPSLGHDTAGWHCYVCGYYEGDATAKADNDDIADLWAVAVNATRWVKAASAAGVGE